MTPSAGGLQVWLCCVVSSLVNGGKVRGGLAVTSSAGDLQVWKSCESLVCIFSRFQCVSLNLLKPRFSLYVTS